MKIILDTNIIISDYKLKKMDSILFLRNHHQAGFQCFVSQITLDEVIVNFRKHLKQKVATYNSNINSLNRQISFENETLDDTYIEKQVDYYRDTILTKFKLHNISILSIPEIPHESVLTHLFSGKHPFDLKDNGYKDFLIFNSILETIDKFKSDIILVSNDNDFGGKELHPDLQELNDSENKIILRKTLKDLNENELAEQISKTTAKLEFIKDIFKDEKHQEEYINTVLGFLENENIEIFPDFIYNAVNIIDTPILEGVTFLNDSGKIESVNPITEDIIIVEFSIQSYLNYLFTIHSSDNYQLENFPDDYAINKSHEDYSTFVELSYWFSLRIRIQADMNGTNLALYNIEIEK